MTATPAVTYSSTGVEVTFPVPFPYLDKAHVKLYVNGTGGGPANLTSPAIATITSPYPAGTRISLQRETPEDPLVVFHTGPLSSADINRAVLQSLYLVQEQQALFMRTLRALPGYTMTALPASYPGSIPEFDNAGNPQALPTDDLIEELLRRGVLGDGQIWPTTGDDFVVVAPGTTLTLDFTVAEAWMFPLFRNGVPQRPGVDYTLAVDGFTVTVVGGYVAGDRFWGYRSGGVNSVILQRGVTSPEANWVRADGIDWTNAMNRAVLTGKRVQGDPTMTYGIATPLNLAGQIDLRDIAFKDLAPQATGNDSRRLVQYTDTGRCRMWNVSADRNGDGSGGTLGNASAFWIANAGFVDLQDIEVKGNNAGSGIRLVSCASGHLTRARVHDMTAGTPSSANPGNGTDQLIGIWSVASLGVTLDDCVVKDLLSQCVDYGPENINTRGITLGGTGSAVIGNNVAVSNCFVSNVDECYDYTGDQWPIGITTTGCRAEYGRKFGFKCAGTVLDSMFTGCVSFRCTISGFYIQGGSTDPQTGGIRLVNCTALNSGYNADAYLGAGATTSGFRCDFGTEDTTHPRNVVFEECRARGGTEMKYGFVNSVAVGSSLYRANDRNKLIRCTAEDYTVAAQDGGFVDGYSILGREEDQAIPDSAPTLVSFDRVHGGYEGLGLLPGSGETRSPLTDLVFTYDARVLVNCYMPFNLDTPSHGVGYRSTYGHLTKVIGGTPVVLTIGGGRDIRDANATSETTPCWTAIMNVNAGDILQIYAEQTSGVSTALNGSDMYLTITDLDSPAQIVQFIPTA